MEKRTHFTEKQLLHFRAKLEAKRNSLVGTEREAEYEGLIGLSDDETGEISHIRTHSADLGTQEFDRDLDLEFAEKETEEIQDVAAALLRIHDHTYGFCENCDREIPFSRLEALPETQYCLDCERKLHAGKENH